MRLSFFGPFVIVFWLSRINASNFWQSNSIWSFVRGLSKEDRGAAKRLKVCAVMESIKNFIEFLICKRFFNFEY